MLVRYTRYGDANVDSRVDVRDLYALAVHWQTTGDWVAGDFNYDGAINLADLNLLAGNWQEPGSLGELLAGAGLADSRIPEPSGTEPLLMTLALALSAAARAIQVPRRQLPRRARPSAPRHTLGM